MQYCVVTCGLMRDIFRTQMNEYSDFFASMFRLVSLVCSFLFPCHFDQVSQCWNADYCGHRQKIMIEQFTSLAQV